ncbi:MAG: 2-hydroxyacid dehydrogenase [Bacteroidia bacterium]|nr:2-hydroxyacid dehydrogenase [Bacteroidia bacterium]NND11137.1 hydroxyacid dehydrogenase [Flavobacteriaceae bacterium]MBT8311178.1 2-hydroxyacid dehydrogenase [Bacteroidia bacterium]NNK27729.1 hydroxyacid dehydrogenase [Flavobacteriaceae bacterium]NNL61196.1 hydroxyacid dehydrogenase [Flavobacteriaceae bacterium]
MKILHLDKNHPLLIEQLSELGCLNHEDYSSSKQNIEGRIHAYEGIVIRSRFDIDKQFLDKAKNLKFIGRVGAGLESIDTEYALQNGIELFSAPEGNRNAVAEHTLGMLLSLMNKLFRANKEVKNGQWNRESNRGEELDGKTIGLIGYGNMGKAFAKKLKGFDVRIICHDIKDNVGDENATQVSLKELKKESDVLSLHTPLTQLTKNMIDHDFISEFEKPFYFLNTARGKSVVTSALVEALDQGKIKGAGLDVLEYEKSSFEELFRPETPRIKWMRKTKTSKLPEAFQYLMQADNVILSPHIAGWTLESKIKLAQTIVDKIKARFFLT